MPRLGRRYSLLLVIIAFKISIKAFYTNACKICSVNKIRIVINRTQSSFEKVNMYLPMIARHV